MRSFLLLLLLACGAAAACGNPNALTAFISNRDTTVSLYALSGTAVSLPSGYSILGQRPVRTDQGAVFDFAFDIDTAGRALLLPTGALRLGGQTGLQLSTQAYDSIRIAPTGGYQLDSAVVVHDSSVVLAHSSTVACASAIGLSFPYYAKLLVVAIDTNSTPNENGRRIDFKILTDLNCGFRGLEEGVPRH